MTTNRDIATSTFSTKWVLKGWILVLTIGLSTDQMNEAIRGAKRVTDGKTVVYNFASKGVLLYGRIQNRPGFPDDSGVTTSAIDRIEMIDGSLYAVTNSGSCYRLEDGINGFGVYDGKEIVVETTKEDGSVSRYIL